MHRWLWLFSILMLTGCAHYFKVPQAEYRQKVQTLGVLPLLVDGNSAITHPDREAVVELLRRNDRDKHQKLIELLREQKGYFDVRPVEGDPRDLFRKLVRSDELRGEGAEAYRHYNFNPGVSADLAERNAVDALLVIVLHGEVHSARRWDRRHLSYLDADYSDIMATAAVVTPSGETVWEYPEGADGTFLNLQYPDFDEAYYNRSDTVRIKYISPEGLGRTLEETGRSLFGRTDFPSRYGELFESISTALKPGLLNPFKKTEPSKEPG